MGDKGWSKDDNKGAGLMVGLRMRIRVGLRVSHMVGLGWD